jgi:quercetin dioxygenase-like cupin family protein
MLGVAHATPPSRFSAALLGAGPLPSGARYRTEQGAIELDRLTIRPGGSSGWHSHSGPLILIVKQGTITNYLAGAHGCVRRKLTAGRSYLEPADTPHLALNEGTKTVVFYAVVNHRKGGDSADDAKRPAGCHA